ncbi:EAL domain-containing protein [Amphritea opalescens]|nr:EAL domain-containing protein [Amphritea opalescens]
MPESIVSLESICSQAVLHAQPTDAALHILHRMRQSNVSSIVIMDHQEPLGIITEKDILRLVSSAKQDLAPLTAADIMTSPVKTMQSDCDFQQAYEQMQRDNLRHIVVINRDGSLNGIATETDFIQHLGVEYLAEIKHVDAVMERVVQFISPQATLRQAFTLMNQNMISCVVVGEHHQADGILTERDVIRLLDDKIDLNTTVEQHMSTPVTIVDAKESLLEARQIMQTQSIRRLLVSDAEGHIVGLLTRQHLLDKLQTHFVKVMRNALETLNQKLLISQHRAEHYHGFFESSPLAYHSLDAEGNFLEINACWRTLLGYENSEVIGKSFLLVLEPEQEQQFKLNFAKFIQQGHIENVYYRLVTKSGDRVDVQLDGRVVHNEATGFAQTHCLLTNLTEKHKVDAQLRLFRQLIDHSNDALFVINAKTARIIDINQASCDYLGYSREQLLNTRVIDFSATHQDLDSWQRILKILLSNTQNSIFESVHRTVDGREVPVEISSTVLNLDGEQIVLSTVRDITERKLIEKRSRQESDFLQAVIDCIGDPVTVIGTDYRVIKSNRAADDYFYHCLQQDDKPCYRSVDQHGSPCDICPLTDVMESQKPTTRIHEHALANGETRTFELMASPLYDTEGNITGLVESSRDITDHIAIQKSLQEKEKSLDFLAHHDTLTKLPNRLLFNDRLKQALLHAKRLDKTVGLLFIDLDEFKGINDSFGHNLGDQLLIKVSERLQHHVRDYDTISRLGGDEFTIIVEDIQHPDDLALIAQNLQTAFNEPIILEEQQLHISLSIGISVFPDDAEQPEDLVRNADTAMYRAKSTGKNRYEFYTHEMTDQALERIMMLGAMRNAIEHDQFILHYQPQIDITDNRIIGAEALIRWKDPQLGLIPPDRFIPLAEKNGMIKIIDLWVLDTVCRNIRQWQIAGYQVPRISVNISARHFGTNNLPSDVETILKRNQCSSDMIELEITEGVILNNPARAGKELKQIRDMGIRLAIDDFGTGYSSLSYLKSLPLDRLKIDHSFITDIPEDQNDQAIARAVIALSNSLGLEVIAEGMETEQQRQFLIDEGCLYAQGFLFSKGVPEEEFLALLNRH